MTSYTYQFTTPARMLFVATTGFGKTYRMFRIMEYANELFDNPKQFETVYYYYSLWSDTFDEYKHLVTEFIEGVPTEIEFKEKVKPHMHKNGCVVVLDDFLSEINSDIVKIFTKLGRNTNTTVMILWQTLFPKEKPGLARTISLNCSDLIVFKNVRDKSQFQNFARQFAPGKSRILTNLYRRATEQQHSYLWIDLRDSTDEKYRLLSNVTPDQWPMEVFVIDT